MNKITLELDNDKITLRSVQGRSKKRVIAEIDDIACGMIFSNGLLEVYDSAGKCAQHSFTEICGDRWVLTKKWFFNIAGNGIRLFNVQLLKEIGIATCFIYLRFRNIVPWQSEPVLTADEVGRRVGLYFRLMRGDFKTKGFVHWFDFTLHPSAEEKRAQESSLPAFLERRGLTLAEVTVVD